MDKVRRQAPTSKSQSICAQSITVTSTSTGARLGFRLREAGGERIFISGFQMQRLFLDDFDLAFRRQAHHGEMLAHDVVPIRIHGVTHAGLILATRSSAAKKSDHVCRCSFSAFLPSGMSL